MLLKSTIEESVNEQLKSLQESIAGYKRENLSSIHLNNEVVTIITGIRRCGKSTLMFQLISEIEEDFGYFNFEDPRIFGFDIHDFDKLHEVLGNKKYYFFDEIQNIDKWELFIRKLHDQKKTICITGSNASLLSKELGTRLTGRNIQMELFPFSYLEFCGYTNSSNTSETVEKYLTNGGFPSFLKTEQIAYLQQLFKDILFRDIIVRYGVRNANTVEGIALYLLSNVAKEYSLNGLKNTFKVGSANSVADYVSWFEDSYLLFSVPRFSWSLKSVVVNPKKVYTIDTGFAQANSLSFSSDKGRLFENMIYIQLRRKGYKIYYFREKGECDFVIQDKQQIIGLLQVCYILHADNFQREVNGLKEAMDYFKMETGTIITLNQNEELILEGKKINVISADKWIS